jgi:ribonuclease Z
MPTLHLLGTGAGYSDPHRTTTMMAFSDGSCSILVDCGGDAVKRMMQSGIDLESLEAIIITHEHPDHCGGFPLLIERLWLAGRRRPIHIYGPSTAVDQARRTFATFDTSRWEGLPDRIWHEVPAEEGAFVLENDSFYITGSPGVHGVPVIGIRVQSKQTGRVVTYSCDTRPCPAMVELGRDADILVHEATGLGPVHSSIEEAAQVAAQAGAKRLILIHLSPGLTDSDVQAAFPWHQNVELAVELGTCDF